MGTTKTPEWADPQLSQDLPTLRARGERQDLEYMECFPKNARELAKEIAAFATSTTGQILLGVNDDGDLVGLSDAAMPQGRDTLFKRIEGICTSAVKPSVTPTVRFAIESDAIVLVVTIAKGAQPVYYANDIPYVRHLTQARPATPEEVIERVRDVLPTVTSILPSESSGDGKTALYSRLSQVLTTVLMYADETDQRSINPWLELWRAEFGAAATELRELASLDIAGSENVQAELRDLADSLDAVATMRLHLGCGPELKRLTNHAADRARRLKAERIDTLPLGPGLLDHIRTTTRESARRLGDLASRAQQLIDAGRIEQLQSEAAAIGQTLLRLAYYDLSDLGSDFASRLQHLGHTLHLAETMRLVMDGGRSLQAVADRVSLASQELAELVGAP